MALEGEQQAVKRVGPALAADSNALNRASRIAAPADGSGSWTIPGAGGNGVPGCWVTITALTGPLTIAFGAAGMANSALANDFVLPQDSTHDYWCNQGITTVKFASTGGLSFASVHRSSL